MKIRSLIIIIGLGIICLNTACKSEFEKIRASGDTASILQKANEYYDAGEFGKSAALLELIIGSYRGKQELEDIYFKYANTYYNQGKYILASYYFKNFTKTFPNSKYREEADFMSAYSNYQMSPTFRLDQTYSLKAIDEFQLFANTYPDSERVSEANQLIDQMRKKLEVKAYEEGQLYFDVRQYQASMHSFENMLKDFPETTNNEEVRYMIIKASYLLAENSVVDKQAERYLDAEKKAERFMTRFPKSKYYNEVNIISKKVQKK